MKVLLFSGGIDSSALAYWIRPDVALTVDYGQRTASAEIEAAAEIARLINVRHEIVRVDCSAFGVGHMAGRQPSHLGQAPEWWPYRNQLLVTVAGMRFVSEGLNEIALGSVVTDTVHADGRPEFLQAMDGLMRLQEGNVAVTTPASKLTSESLVEQSKIPARVLAHTFSCHVSAHPCGQCRGCQKHQEVLQAVAQS